jgi:hypothetical protein
MLYKKNVNTKMKIEGMRQIEKNCLYLSREISFFFENPNIIKVCFASRTSDVRATSNVVVTSGIDCDCTRMMANEMLHRVTLCCGNVVRFSLR